MLAIGILTAVIIMLMASNILGW